MKINYICNANVKGDINVQIRDESALLEQPNLPKESVGMFNYWSECKRSNLSNEATTSRLVLDFDDGIKRSEAEELYKEYDYIIYNSTGNNAKEGISKFRMILKLKEPIDAQSLRHHKMALWKKMFRGADYSTFSIGRFFYRPSKYDKGGDEVIISHHKGKPFDFYAEYPHYVENEMFNAIVQKMRMKPYKFSWDLMTDEKLAEKCNKLQNFIVTHEFTHYAFVPNVVGKGKALGLDFLTVKSIFDECYQGTSDWNRYFEKCWNGF